jgi:hypothetical protein
MQHTFERENDRHVVLDAKTGYSMSVSTPTRSLGMVSRVCFASRIGKSLHPIPITNRDLRQYKTELPGLPIDPALQYLEVGAGLGGADARRLATKEEKFDAGSGRADLGVGVEKRRKPRACAQRS